MATNGSRRWFMVAAATLLMVCLGTVYAWSYFQGPLMQRFGWNNAQVSLAFSLAIFFLGASAAVGGVLLPKTGPRPLALLGSVLFSLGYALAGLAFSLRSLPLLYLGYGAIGGTGLGLEYVTPVATVAKWFPDRKGLATGIVTMGFGFGALAMSKILAPVLLALAGGDLVIAFPVMAAIFLVVTFLTSLSLKNPHVQAAAAATETTPPATPAASPAPAPDSPLRVLRHSARDIFSKRFALLWALFFCNISAGITIIGFQSPMFQKLWHAADPSIAPERLAVLGATLIAVTSIFNGAGRMFWGAVSDRLGRIRTFRMLLGSELAVFVALIFATDPWVFAILLCWILLCYGGAFGAMPATVSELFGQEKMTVLYGCVLTAWSMGGIAGPQITAFITDRAPERASTLSFVAGSAFIALGFLFSLLIGPGKGGGKEAKKA